MDIPLLFLFLFHFPSFMKIVSSIWHWTEKKFTSLLNLTIDLRLPCQFWIFFNPFFLNIIVSDFFSYIMHSKTSYFVLGDRISEIIHVTISGNRYKGMNEYICRWKYESKALYFECFLFSFPIKIENKAENIFKENISENRLSFWK